jgi:uroporphyrinogen-III synthase
MSLAGRGVLITRPRDLAAGLAALVERAGGKPFLFPAIEIERLPPPAILDRAREFDLAVFVSPSAVEAAGPGRRWPRTAAIGAGTRQALERLGVGPVIAPKGAADSEALLALPELQDLAGRRVLVVRGEGGRPLLADTLASRGARVEHAECYRRRRPAADPAALLAAWAAGKVQAVTVSSSEGLDNLLALLGAPGAARLRETPLFVPHARVAALAERAGVKSIVVAGPSDAEMLERLVAYFAP